MLYIPLDFELAVCLSLGYMIHNLSFDIFGAITVFNNNTLAENSLNTGNVGSSTKTLGNSLDLKLGCMAHSCNASSF